MMGQNTFIIFALDAQRYALAAQSVKKVIRAVTLTYLSDPPELFLGLLNHGNTFIPVINIREQLGLPQKALQLSDRIIITEISRFAIGFIVDQIDDVMILDQKPLDQSVDIFPGMENCISGITRHKGHTILVYDIHQLFPEHMVKQLMDDFKPIEAPL